MLSATELRELRQERIQTDKEEAIAKIEKEVIKRGAEGYNLYVVERMDLLSCHLLKWVEPRAFGDPIGYYTKSKELLDFMNELKRLGYFANLNEERNLIISW